jgi:hypothetical protein
MVFLALKFFNIDSIKAFPKDPVPPVTRIEASFKSGIGERKVRARFVMENSLRNGRDKFTQATAVRVKLNPPTYNPIISAFAES